MITDRNTRASLNSPPEAEGSPPHSVADDAESPVRRQSTSTEDRHPWRAAILLSVALVSGVLLWTMSINPALKHVRLWTIAGDAWPPLEAARYVASGAFPYLYQANRAWVAGPLLPVLLAPIAALQDWLGLTSRNLGGYAFQLDPRTTAVGNVPYPAIWPIYGAYTMALSGVLLVAVRRTTRVLLELSGASGHRFVPVAAQIATAALGVSLAVGYWMHLEDVLGIAMLLFALIATVRGRWVAAGVCIGIAVGFKQWTALPALLFLSSVPSADRRRFVLAAVGIPAVFYGIPLLAARSATFGALFEAGSAPWLGHAAPWIRPTALHVVGATPGRLIWTAFALCLAWLLRRRRGDLVALCSAAALILAARLATEAVTYSYYLLGVIVFMILVEVALRRSVLRTAVTSAAALAWFWVPPPRVWWWFVEMALLGLLVWPAGRHVWQAIRRPGPDEEALIRAMPAANAAPDPTPLESVIPPKTM